MHVTYYTVILCYSVKLVPSLQSLWIILFTQVMVSGTRHCILFVCLFEMI